MRTPGDFRYLVARFDWDVVSRDYDLSAQRTGVTGEDLLHRMFERGAPAEGGAARPLSRSGRRTSDACNRRLAVAQGAGEASVSAALRHSPYPIGRLLLHTLLVSGLRTGAFVRALGYSSLNAGAAALDAWVRDGKGKGDFLDRLQESPYAVPPDALQVALDRTLTMKRAEQDRDNTEAEALARTRFCPYVRAVPEKSIPSSITLFALSGGWRRDTVRMPVGIALRSEARQDVLVGRAVRRHFAAVDGQTRFMRGIVKYQFVAAYRAEPVLFTVDGLRTSMPPPTPVPSGDAVLYVGRRKVAPATFHGLRVRP